LRSFEDMLDFLLPLLSFLEMTLYLFE